MDTARRSRTTERSESVSEEAEERLNWHFLLTGGSLEIGNFCTLSALFNQLSYAASSYRL
ncbi:hypothetical protein COD45_26435 [Escherichia coli]|nr:hypothetical protein [Escherichia coli]PSY58250.1 hypothetical protein C7B16_24055 [Escherichia sp. 20412-1]EFC4504095.1 hypothetical protein [Escherichia coli]EFO1079511.1 hypothetical protein [Escherichia coli]PBR54418.1 hypothetical protein COD45_26435 [Escherichia coli]